MEESHITIDTNTFPILQLTSDKRIILDYGGDLPPGIVDLVQLDPGNYEVVKLDEHENMKSVLGKVIDAAGYDSVDKTGNPLLVGDSVQFEISGDWVIYGDEFIEAVKVVNVIGKGDAPLDPQLKDSIHTHGIDMVDVYMTGEGEDPETVEEVLPKGTVADALAQIAVRCADDAHVRTNRRLAAEALEAARLEGTKEPALHLEGELTDFVDEDRTAV